MFSKFGSLHSITLPLDGTTRQPRGFAFIYYLSLSSATAALAQANATRIYSGMAQERIDSEGGKGGNKKEMRTKKKIADKENGGGGGERGRVVAVDWAVGKDEFKRAQMDEVVESAEEVEDSESGSEEESAEEKDDEDDMSPVPEGAEDEESVHHADDDDDELDEEPKGPEPPKGTTLFVRNMSFEATESELYDLCVLSTRRSRVFLCLYFLECRRRFKAFGPVRYARIVFDPTTKRSRGTAFVCFWNDEDAQKVLYESEVLNAGLYGEVSTSPGPFCERSLM